MPTLFDDALNLHPKALVMVANPNESDVATGLHHADPSLHEEVYPLTVVPGADTQDDSS